MPGDSTHSSAGETRLAGPQSVSAFDHGGYPPGTVLAERYRIVGLLGRGGMGEVYRADDLTLGQSVALKFLPAGIDRDRASLERLLSEVRTARQVSHPNVCRVHDVAEADGRRFISMEYIDGEDLSVLLRRIGRLPADKGVDIARQLCAGLAASHDRGVLHRDLKPANIMLDGRGRVRITDFGLAMALSTDGRGAGEFAGTPAYMAPEQLAGQPVTVQTDIYALGLVLYEVFTGRRFHEATTLDGLRAAHASGTSVDLSHTESTIDPAVARVIERCLDPDPRRRPASCALVAASLPGGDPLAAAIAAGETPSPQLVAAAAVQGALSPRAVLVLGAAFVVCLIVAAMWLWSPARHFGIARSTEVLSAQTRDLLARLGYADPPADTAAGFRYRYPDWRDPSLAENDRPWSSLKALRPAAVFFWYREQSSAMTGSQAGRIGLEGLAMTVRSVEGVGPEVPSFEPGSVYVERGVDGSLDTLYVVPTADSPARALGAVVNWESLFEEARLDLATFSAVTPDPALALPGDRRLAWARDAGDATGPLRVEAAEFAGRPAAFRVMSPRTTHEFGATPFNIGIRSWSSRLTTYVTVGLLVLSYLGVAFFIRRNLALGRGDRRGAARLFKAIAGLIFAAGLLSAAPTMDVRLIGTLQGAAALGLFAGAFCWAYYLAIEPSLRRQWPRVLVGWSRLMAGEWRDPQVGREIFIGGLLAVATSALVAVAVRIGLWNGVEPTLHELFYFRALDGPASLLVGLLQILPWSVFVALVWAVLLLLARRLLRSDWLAMSVIAVLSIGVAPSAQWAFVLAMLVGNIVTLVAMLRIGFLTLVGSVAFGHVYAALPFSPGAPGVVGTLSWVSLAAVVVPAAWGLYTALAGQSILGDDRDA